MNGKIIRRGKGNKRVYPILGEQPKCSPRRMTGFAVTPDAHFFENLEKMMEKCKL
jgi:hypothetical protein